MPGHESALLRRRLAAERGLHLSVFHYDSVHEGMAQIATRLHALLEPIEAPQVHLLGHSLGGLVIMRCLERYPMAQPGRVVFLGTPVAGSRAARLLARSELGRRLLGAASAEELLLEHTRRWQCGRELGIIAGTRPWGFGRLLLKFDEDNDGTVALSETRLAGAAGFLPLPVTHSSMLWSARVARETGSFLEYGGFGR